MKKRIAVTPVQLAWLVADSFENRFNRTPMWTMLDDLSADDPRDIALVPAMIHEHRRGEPVDPHLRSAVLIDSAVVSIIDNSFAGLRRVLGDDVEAPHDSRAKPQHHHRAYNEGR